MEYTGNDMKSDIPLTTSLLKIFSMFEISLTVGDVNVAELSLMYIKCKRSTGLKPKSGKDFYDKIITPFVMNSMLHHVGMSWMIGSKKEMDYDNFTNTDNVGWFETGLWHNKNICSKLYGTAFEGFIKQAITDRYNIMCSSFHSFLNFNIYISICCQFLL